MAAAPTVAHACAHDVTRGHARLFAASIRHPCALSRRFPRSLSPFPDTLGVYTPPCAFFGRVPHAPIAARPAIRLFGIGGTSRGCVIGRCAGVRLGGMVALVRLCFGDPSRSGGVVSLGARLARMRGCMRVRGRRSMTLRRDFFGGGGACNTAPLIITPLPPLLLPPWKRRMGAAATREGNGVAEGWPGVCRNCGGGSAIFAASRKWAFRRRGVCAERTENGAFAGGREEAADEAARRVGRGVFGGGRGCRNGGGTGVSAGCFLALRGSRFAPCCAVWRRYATGGGRAADGCRIGACEGAMRRCRSGGRGYAQVRLNSIWRSSGAEDWPLLAPPPLPFPICPWAIAARIGTRLTTLTNRAWAACLEMGRPKT